MRYSVPPGRDEAQYAHWHKESIKWFLACLSLGIIYPVLTLILASSYGLAGGFFTYLWLAFLIAIPVGILQVETSARWIQGEAMNPKSASHLRVEKLVDEVCLQGGIEWRPKVFVLPIKLPNAAATQSFSVGKKVVLFHGILKLSDNELKAVIAHELAHIKHGDIRSLLIVGVVRQAMQMILLGTVLTLLFSLMLFWMSFSPLAWILAISLMFLALAKRAFMGVLVWGYVSLMPYLPESFLFFKPFANSESLWFLGSVWLLTIASQAAWYLLFAAFSRNREYLADAGSVSLIGWHNRIHLATGLHYLATKIGGFEGIDEDAKRPDWIQQHPTVGKRLKALDIDDDDLMRAAREAELNARPTGFRRLFIRMASALSFQLNVN